MSYLSKTYDERERDFADFARQVYELLRHFTGIEEFEEWLKGTTRPLLIGTASWGPFPNYSYPDAQFSEWREMGSVQDGNDSWWYLSRPPRHAQRRHGYIARNLDLDDDMAIQQWIKITDSTFERINNRMARRKGDWDGDYSILGTNSWSEWVDSGGDLYYDWQLGDWDSANDATVFYKVPKQFRPLTRILNYLGGIE
jgi:hypothetical protein